MTQIDTSTAAVEARCQHLDHVSRDRKSADAALMRALATERDALEAKLEWAADKVEDLEDRIVGAYQAGRKAALEEMETAARAIATADAQSRNRTASPRQSHYLRGRITAAKDLRDTARTLQPQQEEG